MPDKKLASFLPELDALIGDDCDGLIIGTGHFDIDDLYVYTQYKKIGKVYFTHNSREYPLYSWLDKMAEAGKLSMEAYRKICFENAKRLYRL